MKNNHDNHYRDLTDDPDFTVEEIRANTGEISEEMKDAGEENHPPSLRRWNLLALPLLLFICLLLALAGGQKKKEDPAKVKNRQATEETVSVTEAEKDDPDEKAPSKEAQENDENRETAMETEKKDFAPEEDLSWQNVIFGSYETDVVSYPISILGLTENEKNLTGFRESDFVRSLSSFLSVTPSLRIPETSRIFSSYFRLHSRMRQRLPEIARSILLSAPRISDDSCPSRSRSPPDKPRSKSAPVPAQLQFSDSRHNSVSYA